MNFSPIIEYVENTLCKEKNVPGCDMKIMRNHETLLRYSTGVRDYAGKEPIRRDDLYHLYSCSKPMTCAAAMQLVERGMVKLDDPVHKYLPVFKNIFLMKGGKRLPAQNVMTIRHLFTMSAGLNYDRDTQPIRDVIAVNPHAGTVEIINALAQSPLEFEPGERFLYSMCHDVLAAVVEVASGQRFSRYMQENIWEPLGMKDTGFHLLEDQQHRLVALYECDGPGHYNPYANPREFNLTDRYESGGAGLYSTVDDYSLFADAMANGGIGITGNQILKAETIDRMRTEQLGSYVMDDRFGCAAGPGYGYGLGVRTLIDRTHSKSSLGEFGWDGAAGAYVMMDPKYGLSIFFAMHVHNWPALIGCGHAPIRDLTYEVLGLE